MKEELYLSRHLQFVPAGGLVYHALFGNLCSVDSELEGFLRTGCESIRYPELTDIVGVKNAEELLKNYFFVESPDEERALIKEWLAEREKLLPQGFFLEALQVSSSNLCNFACAYCFADTSDKRSALRQHISAKQPTLAFETAQRAIDALCRNAQAHGRKNVGVKFLGREPLVNWRTIDRLLEHYRNGAVQWSMTTNGSLITDEVAKKLREHRASVVVSIDGPPQTNNALRVLKTQGSSYDLSESGVRALSSAKLPFGISSVISSATKFETFIPFIRRMANFGAREFELTLVMQTDCFEAQKHAEGDEGLLDFLMEVYREGKRLGVLIHGDWIDPFHRILSTRKRREDREVMRDLPAGCSATSHQISLESSGDLFPCRAMSMHYGHIDDLSSALSSEAYQKVGMRTFFNVPYCHGCKLEGFCQGTCLGACEETSGDIYSPQESYCDLYRRATEKLLNTYIEEKKEHGNKESFVEL
jgi:uncharacterized protein